MATTKKRIDIIREKCELSGLPIHKVFRLAGVSVSTIRNWTYNEPQAFQIEEKINETIELLISENQNFDYEFQQSDSVCISENKAEITIPTPVQRRRS